MKQRINTLEHMLKNHYEKNKSPSHGWDHIQRVLGYALKLSKSEKPDMNILIPSVLLHDIDRGRKAHFDSSLPMRFLKKAGYSDEESKRIMECIEAHSTFSDKKPGTIEEKILFDADKLDSFGALGIARFFMFAGENSWDLKTALKNASKRISNLEGRGFYTEDAEKIGSAMAEYSVDFFKKFKEILRQHREFS